MISLSQSRTVKLTGAHFGYILVKLPPSQLGRDQVYVIGIAVNSEQKLVVAEIGENYGLGKK